MGNKTVTIILASLTFVGAGLYLFLSICPLPPRLQAAPHEGLGEALAQQAAKLLGNGGRVLIIKCDTSMFLNPAADAQFRSLTRMLKKSGARIAATNLVKFDPLRVVSVPSGDFVQMLKKTSEADVVVSLLGAPVLTDEQIARLGDRTPKLVAVCSGERPRQVDLQRLFDRKLLHVAIISRAAMASAPPVSSRAQDWFDYLFTVVTPANVADLPAFGARR